MVIAAPRDLGVDEREQLIAVLGHVDHDHALVHVDLGCGQADTRCVVHGFGHVAHQLPNAVVDFGYRLGLFMQARVRVAKDRK
ncbi:hypothetical protein D3C78_1802150 [compost metagenome]